MYTYFIILIFWVTLCNSLEIEVKDAGIGVVKDGDIAIIFYITIENICDRDLRISVNSIQCCEYVKQNEKDCNPMYLIGGDMGILYPKDIKNVTLIYPNLYLLNRQGVCSISVKYKAENFVKAVMRTIEFKTNGTCEDQSQCPTVDLDPLQNCGPVDCVIKYSGEKNFFNPNTKECECVPICLNDPQKCSPEIVYSIVNNNCTNLNNSVTKYDLELLEKNQVDVTDGDLISMSNIVCHQGDIDTYGQCQCQIDWRTTLDDNDMYEPSLLLYHMCNIETGGWNCVNKSKIKTTSLLIAIFAITIASKLIIIMCLLSWCYRHFRSTREPKVCIDHLDSFDQSLIICDKMESFDRCICEKLPPEKPPQLVNETVNVSYYPCAPSTRSSVKCKIDAAKKSRRSMVSDPSILMSNTTSSSVAISFQSDSEETTDDTEGSSEEDYEIEFSGEEEEEENIKAAEERISIRDNETKNNEEHEQPTDQIVQGEEPLKYTTSAAEASKRGSSSAKSKSSSKKSMVTMKASK